MKQYLPMLLASLCLLASCDKEPVSPAPSVVSTTTSPAVAEAKAWFEKNIPAKANQLPVWEKATVTMKNGQPVIYAPIKYGADYHEAIGERRRLCISLDANGQRQALMVKLVGDNRYLQITGGQIRTTDFSGLELTYSWNSGQFLYGSKYAAGKVVGSVSLLVKNSKTPLATECTTTTIIYYSYSCSGGSCTDPVEVGRDSYTVCVETGSGGNGGGGFGGDGGGGGGGGGPMGGGGGDSGCGSALVCEDGSTNPSVIINKVYTVEGDTPELQAFEQDYRTHMSADELNIFDAMPRWQQVRYLLNAKTALDRAQALYPNSTTDGNGDAFRHALFSLFNSKDLGVNLAKQLGDAHENIPILNPLMQLQKDMDLYNNEQGRQLSGTTSGSYENAVITWLNQGGFKIIENGGLVPSHP